MSKIKFYVMYQQVDFKFRYALHQEF